MIIILYHISNTLTCENYVIVACVIMESCRTYEDGYVDYASARSVLYVSGVKLCLPD
jgi:hypothetical protein